MTGAAAEGLRQDAATTAASRFQHFCAGCGSPLFTSGEDGGPDDWGIRWGSIRQRDQLQAGAANLVPSAAPWINDIKGLPGRRDGIELSVLAPEGRQG